VVASIYLTMASSKKKYIRNILVAASIYSLMAPSRERKNGFFQNQKKEKCSGKDYNRQVTKLGLEPRPW